MEWVWTTLAGSQNDICESSVDTASSFPSGRNLTANTEKPWKIPLVLYVSFHNWLYLSYYYVLCYAWLCGSLKIDFCGKTKNISWNKCVKTYRLLHTCTNETNNQNNLTYIAVYIPSEESTMVSLAPLLSNTSQSLTVLSHEPLARRALLELKLSELTGPSCPASTCY